MNRKILPLIMLFVSAQTGLIAQITITQSDMPNADDSVRVSYSSSSIDPSLTGASYTWDFSAITPDAQTVEVFTPPSGFSSPYNFFFNSFNTSYGVKQYTPDSVGGIQPDDAYNYYKETSSDYKQVGMGISINSVPFPIVYDNPDVIYNFPMNYGNMDSSDGSYSFTIPGYGYYGQTIHRVNEVDGWGSLTTPFGSVSSLRIKSIIYAVDTVYMEASSSGYSYNRPPRYEYKWLSPGSKIPYIEVDASDFGGGPTVTNIIYQDIYQPGTFQLGSENNSDDLKLAVYPNPATDMVFVQYQLSMESAVKIELFDLSGRIVYSQVYTQQNSGFNTQVFNLENINPGTYLFKISGGGINSVQKLVVQ